VSSSHFHESPRQLSAKTIELHRAIRSLIEELEAIDWYAQRIDASSDSSLRQVLAHSLREEKEHAAMTLDWLRRNDGELAACLQKYLQRGGEAPASEQEAPASREGVESSLAIGSLRTGDS
jgi:hypothetical protein